MGVHGKRSTYAADGCRCEACREANTTYHRERRQRHQSLGTIPDGAEHGESGYFNFGCRCKICAAAARKANQIQREQRRKKGLAPDDPRHGRLSTYTGWYCRCDKCKDAAHADYLKKKERNADR